MPKLHLRGSACIRDEAPLMLPVGDSHAAQGARLLVNQSLGCLVLVCFMIHLAMHPFKHCSLLLLLDFEVRKAKQRRPGLAGSMSATAVVMPCFKYKLCKTDRLLRHRQLNGGTPGNQESDLLLLQSLDVCPCLLASL